MRERFTPEDVQTLARVMKSGEFPVCPHCRVVLDGRDVPPRQDVSYVRERLWLVCPSCGRTAVLDRRERP